MLRSLARSNVFLTNDFLPTALPSRCDQPMKILSPWQMLGPFTTEAFLFRACFQRGLVLLVAIAATVTLVSTPASAQFPTDQAPLFDWREGDRAVLSVRKDANGRITRFQCDLEVTRDAESMLILRASTPRFDGAEGASPADLQQVLQLVVPSLRISADGIEAEPIELDSMVASIEKLFEAQQRQKPTLKIKQMIESLLGMPLADLIRMQIDDLWANWVALWLVVESTADRSLQFEVELPSFGAIHPFQTKAEVLSEPQTPNSVRRYQAVSTPLDPATLSSAFLTSLTRTMQAAGAPSSSPPPRNFSMQLRDVVTADIDTNRFRPIRVETERIADVAMDNERRQQITRVVYEFEWQ